MPAPAPTSAAAVLSHSHTLSHTLLSQGDASYVYTKRGQIDTGAKGFLLRARFKSGVARKGESSVLLAPGDGVGLWFTSTPSTLNRTGPFGVAPQLPSGSAFGLVFHMQPAALSLSGTPVAQLSLVHRGSAVPDALSPNCQFAFFSGEQTMHVSHVAAEHVVSAATGDARLRVAVATTGSLHEPPSWQRCIDVALPGAAQLSRDVYFGASARARFSEVSHRLYDFLLTKVDDVGAEAGVRGPIVAAFSAPIVAETLGAGRRAADAAAVEEANELLGGTNALAMLGEAHELHRAKLTEISTHLTKQMRELNTHLSRMVSSVEAHEAQLNERLSELEKRMHTKQAAFAESLLDRRYVWVIPFSLLGVMVLIVSGVAVRKWRQLKKRHLL
jgi:hypothetical protein